MRIIAATMGLVVALSACSTSPPGSDSQTFSLGVEDPPPAPEVEMDRVRAGQLIYHQSCATCHQPDLSGADNWKVRDESGRLKPPPLDSAGHAWHHSDSLLIEVITDGSFDEESDMRGFRDRLSEGDILDVIEFLKSTWGSEERSFQWSVTWQETQQ